MAQTQRHTQSLHAWKKTDKLQTCCTMEQLYIPKARAKHLVARNMLQTTWRLLDAHQLIYMIFRNTTGVEHFNTLAMHPLA